MSGCSGENSRARVQGLRGGVELNDQENNFSARFELVSFRDVTEAHLAGMASVPAREGAAVGPRLR